MRLRGSSTLYFAVGFVIFLAVFAYLELTYTRRVDGTSMLPTFEEGDLVVVDHVPFTSLHIGDVIVYSPPCSLNGASVIHRVVQNTSQGFVTKGDNNPYTDPGGRISDGPITSNCYVGKVVFVVPYIERIASLPYGANYILAALIFIAIIYIELGGRKDKGEGNEGEKDKGSSSTEDGKLMPGINEPRE